MDLPRSNAGGEVNFEVVPGSGEACADCKRLFARGLWVYDDDATCKEILLCDWCINEREEPDQMLRGQMSAVTRG